MTIATVLFLAAGFILFVMAGMLILRPAPKRVRVNGTSFRNQRTDYDRWG